MGFTMKRPLLGAVFLLHFLRIAQVLGVKTQHSHDNRPVFSIGDDLNFFPWLGIFIEKYRFFYWHLEIPFNRQDGLFGGR